MRGLPGSAPPIRTVTDAEVERHFPLVHFMLNRMIVSGKLSSTLDNEDLVAVGRYAVWEALRRWEPGKGAQSTYLSSYVWGYVMKYQRDATKAEGWHRTDGRVATVTSLDAARARQDADWTLLDRLPDQALIDPDDCVQVREIFDWVQGLSEPRRTIARLRLLDDVPCDEVARRLGVSRQYVSKVAKMLRNELRARYDLAAA